GGGAHGGGAQGGAQGRGVHAGAAHDGAAGAGAQGAHGDGSLGCHARRGYATSKTSSEADPDVEAGAPPPAASRVPEHAATESATPAPSSPSRERDEIGRAFIGRSSRGTRCPSRRGSGTRCRRTRGSS